MAALADSSRGDDPPRPPWTQGALLDGATGVLIDGVWRSGLKKSVVRDKFTQQQAAELRAASEADAVDAVSAAALAAETPGCAIMTSEIFAPAVAVVPVKDVDAAIGLVNAGRYGLQAGVFTRDLDVAFDAARRLRVGGVMINDTSSYHADAMPYGGVKDSGYGLEGPRYAVQDMTDPRIIVLNLGTSR